MITKRTRREIAAYEWAMEREQAEQVPCPHCNAQAGRRCRNLITGQHVDHQPAHWQRIKAATQPPRPTPDTTTSPLIARLQAYRKHRR